MEIAGRCHCGNIRFVLDWPVDAAAIPARLCTCSYCTRTGARWTAHPQARLRVDVIAPGAVTRYRFGSETADFLSCATCTVVPIATSRIDGQTFAVVNTNTFEGGPEIEAVLASFDGEAPADRLERRRQRWIGDVTGSSGLPLDTTLYPACALNWT